MVEKHPCDHLPTELIDFFDKLDAQQGPPVIHMIEQPVLTEEGHENPACENELAAAVKNTPSTAERFGDDPEWTVPTCTNTEEIVCGLAYWAVRQSHGKFPPRLEDVLGYLRACLKRQCKHFAGMDYVEWSLIQIEESIEVILFDFQPFEDWNSAEVMGAEKWIDLYALKRNVAILIRDERRLSYGSNKSFERRHGELVAADYFGGAK